MNSEVFNTIIDATREKARTLPEVAEWHEAYESLSKKFGDDGELFDVVWSGINLYTEVMFKLGWELRGDPDKLFDLPDPE